MLKRAVGGGANNSFLTQLMNAFEEKDREAKESEEEQEDRDEDYEEDLSPENHCYSQGNIEVKEQ